MDFPFQNTGVRIEERATDFAAGTVLGATVVNALGDWSLDKPLGEEQIKMYFETKACMSFAALDCLETDLNYKLRMGQIPATIVSALTSLGYIINGRFNFSDRFTAKMSGTIYEGPNQGNNFQNVWDSIRNDGVLPEADWPYPADMKTVQEYYAEIPQALKDKAKKFLDYINVFYERVLGGATQMNDPIRELLKNALTQSPLHVTLAICPPWDASVPYCSIYESQHGVMLYNISDFDYILDHYKPFDKKLGLDYVFPYVYKGFTTIKNVTMPSKPLHAEPFRLLKKNGSPAMYFYGMDKMWHGLGDAQVRDTFTGVYDPTKTIRVDVLPSNISFTVTKG